MKQATEQKQPSRYLSQGYLIGLVVVTLAGIIAIVIKPETIQHVTTLLALTITGIVSLARLEPPPESRSSKQGESGGDGE